MHKKQEGYTLELVLSYITDVMCKIKKKNNPFEVPSTSKQSMLKLSEKPIVNLCFFPFLSGS